MPSRTALVFVLVGCGVTPPPILPPPLPTPLSVAGEMTGTGSADLGRARLSDRALGSSGFACTDCHRLSASDQGLRPAPPLFGLAHRKRYWRGLTDNMAVAVNLCVERYGARLPLDPSALADVLAALATLEGEGAFAEPTYSDSLPENLEAGSPERGEACYERACRHCHEDGEAGPVVGEPWTARALGIRIRRLGMPTHPGGFMPAFPLGAISDEDLRDLTTWLLRVPLR